MKWNKLTSRDLTQEEIEEGLPYDSMWDCDTPEIDETVIVSDGITIWTDTWIDYEVGMGFENSTDDDGLYWMSFPELPKLEETNDQ